MTTKPNVEFENDRVRVTRVKRSGVGSVPPANRNDRLIIYLRDAHIKRKEGARQETLQRRAGEIVWRDGSQHEVEVTKAGEHEVLIVELKS
jgi:hypothetical protein